MMIQVELHDFKFGTQVYSGKAPAFTCIDDESRYDCIPYQNGRTQHAELQLSFHSESTMNGRKQDVVIPSSD